MRKTIIIGTVLCLIGCNTGTSEGEEYACQYAKERMMVMDEDIERIEVTKEDSLLSCIFLGFELNRMYQCSTAFLEDKMDRDSCISVIDSIGNEINDVSDSWEFGDVVNDSLRGLEKHKYTWRKVYTVSITMKSGITRECRVMMDKNGITPYATEKEVKKDLQSITEHWRKTQRILYDF